MRPPAQAILSAAKQPFSVDREKLGRTDSFTSLFFTATNQSTLRSRIFAEMGRFSPRASFAWKLLRSPRTPRWGRRTASIPAPVSASVGGKICLYSLMCIAGRRLRTARDSSSSYDERKAKKTSCLRLVLAPRTVSASLGQQGVGQLYDSILFQALNRGCVLGINAFVRFFISTHERAFGAQEKKTDYLAVIHKPNTIRCTRCFTLYLH